MSAKQYKDACSLIRGLCCNYDRSTGGCLLLDIKTEMKLSNTSK